MKNSNFRHFSARQFLRLLSLVFVGGLVGCNVNVNMGGVGVKGSGIMKSETRELDEFDSVVLEGVGSLNITVGEETAVSLTTDDNLLELIETSVSNGVLTIRPKESINTKGLTIDASSPSLEKIDASGATNVDIKGASGEKLEITLGGAASVTGSGVVEDLQIDASGVGSIKLESLETKTTTIEMSGAGSAAIYASQSVEATINGVGGISIHGNPKNVERKVSGLGRISVID